MSGMKKLFALLFVAAIMSTFLCRCSQDYNDENIDPTSKVSGENGEEEIPEGLYYDEEIGMWVVPLNNPEETEPASTESGTSTRALTMPSGPGGWEPGGVTPPMEMVVAYYLKIWPENYNQWEYIVSLESKGVIVSYHSFGTVPLATSALNNLGLVNRAPNSARFYEREEAYDDGNGNILAAQFVPMPILYAEWPCTLAFPEWMVYEVTGEKIVRMDGQIPDPGPIYGDGGGSTTLVYKPLVTVTTWDSVLNRYVAIPNLPILIQANAMTHEKGRTDANGRYQCKNTYSKSNKFTVTIVWDHPDFYLLKGSSNPLQYTHQTYPDTHVAVKLSENARATIFRAAQWFADNKATHKLKASFGYPGEKMRIFDYTDRYEEGKAGAFKTNESRTRIHIYKQGTDLFPYFRTTIHELGHASMCRGKGKWKYADTGSMIREAWARFTAWYITPLAYKSWGYYGPLVLIADQEWQSKGPNNSKYSALMIDLMDDENQFDTKGGKNDHTYPNDRIKGVPAIVIESIAQNSYACASFEREASKYIGIGAGKYYTMQEFTDYFRAYSEGWVYGGGW